MLKTTVRPHHTPSDTVAATPFVATISITTRFSALAPPIISSSSPAAALHRHSRLDKRPGCPIVRVRELHYVCGSRMVRRRSGNGRRIFWSLCEFP